MQRYTARVRDDEAPLTGRIVELASVYGRYGSPRITGMLRNEGWNVNHKRVERIWRQAGLKVPRKLDFHKTRGHPSRFYPALAAASNASGLT